MTGRRANTTKLENAGTGRPQGSALPQALCGPTMGSRGGCLQGQWRAAVFPEPAGKERLAREHSAFVPPAGSRVPHTALNFRSLVFKNIFPHPKPNKNPPQVPDKVPATHTTTFLAPGLSPWGPGRERLQAEGAAHGRTPAPRVRNQLPTEPSRRTFFFLKCI